MFQSTGELVIDYNGIPHPIFEYAYAGQHQELDKALKKLKDKDKWINKYFPSKLSLNLISIACLGGANIETLKVLERHGGIIKGSRGFFYACNAGRLDIIKYILSKAKISDFIIENPENYRLYDTINILSSLFRPTLMPQLKASDDELTDSLEYLLECFFGDNHHLKEQIMQKPIDDLRVFSIADCFFYFGYNKVTIDNVTGASIPSKLYSTIKKYLPENYKSNMKVGSPGNEYEEGSFDHLDPFQRGMLGYYAYTGNTAGIIKAIALGAKMADSNYNVMSAGAISIHHACKIGNPVSILEELMKFQSHETSKADKHPGCYYLLLGDTDDGSNILHLAANSGRFDFLHTLLNGVKSGDKTIKYPYDCINIVDHNGNTALHALVMTINVNDKIVDMIKLLHDHKLDFTIKNKQQKTALELAIELDNKLAIEAISKLLNLDLDSPCCGQWLFNCFKNKPNYSTLIEPLITSEVANPADQKMSYSAFKSGI